MFGISGPEFFVIVLVAVLVVGPQRLPEYARVLAQGVRKLRLFIEDTKVQIAEEVGPEIADLNLADLDPRNYDPRKIVREALGEDLDAIRKDLANPFQSVAQAAKETSQEAAGAVAGSRASKPLSQMIDDKVKETKAPAAKDPAQAAVQAEAVTAEIPQVEAVAEEPVSEEPDTGEPGGAAEEGPADADAGAEGAPEDAQPEGIPEEVPVDEDAPAGVEDPARAVAQAEAVTAEIPQVEAVAEVPDAGEPGDFAEVARADADAAVEGTPEEEPVSRRDVLAEVARSGQTVSSADEVSHSSAESVETEPTEPAPNVPSSLAEPEAVTEQRVRPLSPREVVRAANAAARTRAEAAAATVDA